MTWEQVGEWEITEADTLLEPVFTSRLIIRASNIARVKPTWKWAGFLYEYLNIPPVGLVRINEKINVSTTEAVLFTPIVFKPSFTLKFFRADWIESLTLTIHQDTTPIKLDSIVEGCVPNGSGNGGFGATGEGNFTPNNPTDNFGFGFTQGFL